MPFTKCTGVCVQVLVSSLCQSPPQLILKDAGELLPGAVGYDEGGTNVPRQTKAAGSGGRASKRGHEPHHLPNPMFLTASMTVISPCW